MNAFLKWLLFYWTCVILSLPVSGEPITVKDAGGTTVTIESNERLVSIGGDITEMIYTLGAEKKLVARDDTSTYPSETNDLPSVGYMRTLSPEGIIALNPTVILAAEGSGPPSAIKHLREAGVPVVSVKQGLTEEDIVEKIATVAAVVGKTGDGESLIQRIKYQVQLLKATLQETTSRPKVLFLMNVNRGALPAAGERTGADAMIRLAGGQNALNGFTGYKPISAEVALAAQPDAILVPSHGVESMGGIEAIPTLPELKHTQAAKERKIIVMDSLYLLMFGPRYVYAAAELAAAIHDRIVIPPDLSMKEEPTQDGIDPNRVD